MSRVSLPVPAFATVLVLLVVIAVIAACAALPQIVDRASDRAADAVAAYCGELTDEQRAAFGDQVREKAAPHSIRVECN